VIVLGDVITDIIVQQAQTLVKGSDTPSKIVIRAGGSAANLACWLANSGPEVHFIGRVGRDPFGVFQQEQLQRWGVIPHLAVDPDLPTGTIVVLLEPGSGERHMLTDRGANQKLSLSDIPWELFYSSTNGWLHLSGYSLLEPATREVALGTLDRAKQAGLRVSVDPSSTTLLREVGPTRFLEWTQGADLCFPNLEEGGLLSGLSNPSEIAQFLTGYYREVVLKLGAEGAIWADQGGTSLKIAAHPVEVVDCTGAGDAFAAGFISARLKDAEAYEALTVGAKLAARVVGQVGARPETAV
jgi:sugar/nucleoside kinase (ribokinase family)